jgi:signal transduction histidine kinase
MLVRIGVRSTVAAVAFAWAAVIVCRADRERGWLGPRLLAAGLGAYALEHVHYAALTVMEFVTREGLASYAAYLSALDVVINFVIALGMVMWLLERERDRAVELEARAARSDKLESLGQLAGGVAHDFNNLLTGIVANSSLVAEELPEGSRAHQRVRDIHAQAQRAAGLSRQILTYAGRGGRRAEPMDLSALVGEMSQLLSSVISKGAKLSISLAPDLPATLADPDQIRQVVMNLIINASEALEGEPGVVSVSTGVVGSMQGREVYVEVADTGAGMSPEVQARMFDPYFTTRARGRGLGLSTALGIVRAHDGSIRVQSHPGKGTTVRVTLPATNQPPVTRPEPVPRLGQRRGSGTVLVVDDEPSVRRAAQRVLEVGGFQVLAAGDGVEGIELFAAARSRIVAVVLDLTMPRLSGRDTFQQLRRLRPDVPVVVCSGYTQEKTDEWLDGEPLAVFLEKPFEPAQLLDVLHGLLNSAAPADRSAG